MAIKDFLMNGILGSNFDEDFEEAERLKKKAEEDARLTAAINKQKEKDSQGGRSSGILGGLGNLVPVVNMAEDSLADLEYAKHYDKETGEVDMKGKSPTGILYENIANAIAPQEALDYAEKNVGAGGQYTAPQTQPTNPAYFPADASPSVKVDETPEDPVIASAQTFGKDAALLDSTIKNETNINELKNDFGSNIASTLATLATFGGMLFTGAGIPFALAAAASAWGGTEPMRQREAQAKDLHDKGYDNAEITNFVHNGVLNQVPNAQRQAQEKEALEIKRMEKEAYVADKKAKQEAKDQEGLFGFKTPEVRQMIQTTRTYLNDVGLKAARFDQSYESAKKALELYDKGDTETAGKVIQGAMEAFAKGFQGGNKSLDPRVVEAFGGNPNYFVRKYEQFRMGLTGSFSREEIQRILKASQVSKEVEHEALGKRLDDLYWNLVQKGEQPNASLQLTKGLAAGSGAYDWYPTDRSSGERKN